MAWQDLFVGQQPGLSDQDRQNLARGGLLQAGLSTFAANSQPGVSPIQAIAGGLLGGIQSSQQSARQLQDDQFQQTKQQFAQAQMADQQEQINIRRDLQDMAKPFFANGKNDMQGYIAAVQQKYPQQAMELQQNEQRNQLAQLQMQKAQRDINTAQTREIASGNSKVTQEQQSDGTWKTIATAPLFANGGGGQQTAIERNVKFLMAQGASRDQAFQALGLPVLGAATNSQPVTSIEQVPQADRPSVQALLDGRSAVPTGKQALDPTWMRRMEYANQLDPTLDAASYKSRAAARQQFTSGKLGEQVKALNTLAGHLATLNDSLDQLDNSDIGIFNKGMNLTAGLGNSSRAKALGTYSTAAKAVGDEAAKVFAGGQSALGDRQEISHGLDPAQPNAQLRATLQTYAELVQSRLAAIQDQSQQALGYGSKSIQVVTPKAAATFQKLAGGEAPTANLPGPSMPSNSADPLGIRSR